MNFSTKLIRLSVALGFAALTGVSFAPASLASPLGDPPSITVRYDDLNLANKAGVEALYQRIKRAASEVCDAAEGQSFGPGIHRGWSQCYHQAVSDAVGKVNNTQLAVLHAQSARGFG